MLRTPGAWRLNRTPGRNPGRHRHDSLSPDSLTSAPGLASGLPPSPAPGLIDTEMGKPPIEAGVATRIPVGRPGTGEEVAKAVLLLACNAYMTGQTIAVNGGSLFS